MPFLKAPPAATSCGVLSKKNGVGTVAHRGLFSVVRNMGGGETLSDYLGGMLPYCFNAFRLYVFALRLVEKETASKLRFAEFCQNRVGIFEIGGALL